MARYCRAACVVLATLVAGPGMAAEMRAHGDVVEVIPISAAGRAADCQPPRPTAGAGLAELLAWDLRTTCPAAVVTTGYRVIYRWDGRTYSVVTREPPGATVPLRVRLD